MSRNIIILLTIEFAALTISALVQRDYRLALYGAGAVMIQLSLVV